MPYIDTVVTQREVDLTSLPFDQWPDRARTIARYIISRRWREFQAELPEMRHAWLAARVEVMSKPLEL